MIPKNAKDFIATQAEEEGIPEEDLRDMVMAYWHSLRGCLIDFTDMRIEVIGLGTMTTSMAKINKGIKNVREIKEQGGSIHPVRERNLLLPLLKVKEIMHAEWDKKNIFNQMKREYKRTHDMKGNLINNEHQGDTETSLGESESDC